MADIFRGVLRSKIRDVARLIPACREHTTVVGAVWERSVYRYNTSLRLYYWTLNGYLIFESVISSLIRRTSWKWSRLVILSLEISRDRNGEELEGEVVVTLSLIGLGASLTSLTGSLESWLSSIFILYLGGNLEKYIYTSTTVYLHTNYSISTH